MHSSYYTDTLLGYAREAYAKGVRLEKRYGKFVDNHCFQRAFNILTDIVVENDVAMPPSKWDEVEGLMAGDLADVREAFRILGGYAQMGLINARHVEKRGGYTRSIR